MEKLYYTSPYEREFEARVLSCEAVKKGYGIRLDRTAFYPEGGGQPSDTGILGGVRVTEVREQAGEVVHFTDGPLTPGETVRGKIDWENRFSNMQQHSGEHIVSGLIHRRYGYDNVGFHMGREEMTIDLNGVLDWEQLREIEREANRVVWENVSVHAAFLSGPELEAVSYRSKKELTGEVRIVDIPGADSCACCGTHVARTGEIGVIKFRSVMHYKGGVRISLLCGMRALEDYADRTDQILTISGLLCAKTAQAAEAVKRLKKENEEKQAQVGELWREIFALKAAQYQESGKPLLVFEEGLEPLRVRQLCEALLEAGRGGVVLVCSGREEAGYAYCLGSRAVDVRAAGKKLNTALSGRGGGSERMVQGTFGAARAGIEAAFYGAFGENAPEGGEGGA